MRALLPPACALAIGCSRSDAALQAQLQMTLAADAATSAADITATVSHGTARLTGEVADTRQQARAVALAQAIPGISRVAAEMHLGDEALAQAVRTALAADPLVSRVPLAVTADAGIVHLISEQTSAAERARIVGIASGVRGVIRVDDRMR